MPNPKTYMQRFTSFKNEHCPYCGADGATLKIRFTKKNELKGFTGQCIICGATNNFTKSECKEAMER